MATRGATLPLDREAAEPGLAPGGLDEDHRSQMALGPAVLLDGRRHWGGLYEHLVLTPLWSASPVGSPWRAGVISQRRSSRPGRSSPSCTPSLSSCTKTLLGFGSKIAQSVAAQPDGLLLHENLLCSLLPPHVGMRQYWRDFEALESWARSEPYWVWRQQFLRDSGATGFWHEAYCKALIL
jgi:Domain of unknown function (DUF4188)